MKCCNDLMRVLLIFKVFQHAALLQQNVCRLLGRGSKSWSFWVHQQATQLVQSVHWRQPNDPRPRSWTCWRWQARQSRTIHRFSSRLLRLGDDNRAHGRVAGSSAAPARLGPAGHRQSAHQSTETSVIWWWPACKLDWRTTERPYNAECCWPRFVQEILWSFREQAC